MTAAVIPIGRARDKADADDELARLIASQKRDTLAGNQLTRGESRDSARARRHGQRDADLETEGDWRRARNPLRESVAPREGRHDAHRLPAGYELMDGCLMRSLDWAPPEALASCDEQQRALVASLASNYVDPDGAPLHLAIERLLSEARIIPQTDIDTQRIEAAYRALDGDEPERLEWQVYLEGMIAETARRLTEIEACRVRGIPAVSGEPWRGYRIRIELVRRVGEPNVPRDLTHHVIDSMITRCGLGRGGGPRRQKSVRGVIDDWVRSPSNTKNPNNPAVIRRRKLE